MLEFKSIEKKVKRGDIFFISDFAELGKYEAIRKALQRFTQDGKIGRIAKGIYFLPKTHETLGAIYPHACFFKPCSYNSFWFIHLTLF